MEVRDGDTPHAEAAGLPRVRITDYADRVIHADVVSRPQFVDGAHVTGVNATRGDGSTRWVSRTAFEDDLTLIGTVPGFSTSNDGRILADDQTSGIFAALDAQR